MSRTRIPLDAYDKRPPEMDNYLQHFGWHMNKKTRRVRYQQNEEAESCYQ